MNDLSVQEMNQTVILNKGDVASKRAEIKTYFNYTWEQYELLFDVLASEEVFYERPQPLRHPLLFYVGHTATFFVNKLVLGKLLSERINPRFESLFAIGVDEMSWDDLNDAHYEWPQVAEVFAYRDQVKVAVNQVIDEMEITMPIAWESPAWTILMGIEHERIHLETSSVLIRQLDLSLVKSIDAFAPHEADGREAPQNELISVEGGTVELGRQTHEIYGWDNEFGETVYDVASFRASKYLVSNQEFLGFMEAGGYKQNGWWSDEGRSWREYHQADKPEFWRGEAGEYRLRLMTNEIALPMNWPVEICYHEAQAFCNWKSAQSGTSVRMPDEAEYRRLLESAGLDREHHTQSIEANWNLEQGASSVAVDRFAHGAFYDLVGNVWQWNETPIHAFDGFQVHPLYDDFSTPTFDNRHNLIKGGSWISTGNEITLGSRYAFRRHFYQHAGFRYIESDAEAKRDFDIYETDDLVSQYCEFHYGDEVFDVPNFAKAVAQVAMEATSGSIRDHALDMGCSVGRSAFELATQFKSVDALDFSARFIQMGAQMQRAGRIRYERKEQGDLTTFQERTLSAMGLDQPMDHINFMQQDACNMKARFTGYNLVLAANLIDRLSQPVRFLNDIAPRIQAGGHLVIASPYTWLEEFTPKENWLGGFKRDGEPVSTLDGLHTHLDAHFTLTAPPVKLPFVIRETMHKHQHSLSEVTIWKKK
jgi:5-histidylcysteine sulfoxide synthase/putative 4-mercaptohistidine N1-methyltranferase